MLYGKLNFKRKCELKYSSWGLSEIIETFVFNKSVSRVEI